MKMNVSITDFANRNLLVAEASALGIVVGEIPERVTVTNVQGCEATFTLTRGGMVAEGWLLGLNDLSTPFDAMVRDNEGNLGAPDWVPRRMLILSE